MYSKRQVELFLYVTLLGLSMGDLQLLIKHFFIIYGYFFIINSLWLLFIKAELSQERPRFRNLSHGPRKTGVLRYFSYLWAQIEWEDFNSNKVFNLEGCTVKYGPLKWPIITHIPTERYNNLFTSCNGIDFDCTQTSYSMWKVYLGWVGQSCSICILIWFKGSTKEPVLR